MRKSCDWPGDNELMIQYHDTEWGTPVHDDRTLFEFLMLDNAQAGLSWQTILNKRENYRKAFDNFDPAKISRYTERKIYLSFPRKRESTFSSWTPAFAGVTPLISHFRNSNHLRIKIRSGWANNPLKKSVTFLS